MDKFVAISLVSTLVAAITGASLALCGAPGRVLLIAPLLAFYGVWLGVFLCSEIRYAFVNKRSKLKDAP
jgi:hypothetical protein